MLVHFLRGRLLARKTPAELAEIAAVVEKPWDLVNDLQRDANRSFAFHLGTCGAMPAVAAMVAWSSRSDVVQGICHGLQQLTVSSPLCF
jgi:hypothetical protein